MIKNLVFSGCSSKFYIILGCLKSLFDYKYVNFKTLDNILCSSGSVIVIYWLLLGYTLAEIKDIIMKIDVNLLFYDNRYNKNIIDNIFDLNCIINNKKFREVFEIVTFNKIKRKQITFKELYDMSGVCLIINAFCYDTEEIEYFSYKTAPDMNVIDAALMTISIPILFQPVIYKGKTYCDPCLKVHIDFSYFFKDIHNNDNDNYNDNYNEKQINDETLGIIIESIEYKYITPSSSPLNDDEKISNLIDYLKGFINVILKTSQDYSKYNTIDFTFDLKFYDLDINNDVKNKLILMGYKKTYEYIK